MKILNTLIILCSLAFFASCTGQTNAPSTEKKTTLTNWLVGDTVVRVEGEIRGITQDSKNNLWFASNGNGLYKYDGVTIVNYTEKHGLGSNYIWMVHEGRDGKMWFKIHMQAIDVQAISSFDGSVFKVHEDDTSLAVYDFKKGELIFDRYYDGKTMRKIELPHTSPIQNADNVRHHYDIYSSCIDRHGNAWFGACTAGICKYDGSNFTWFDNKELVSATRDMFEDHNGTVWAGNNGDGLFRFDGTNFINVSREHDLHNPDFEKYPIGKPGLMSRVWKITEDLQGDLWVATIDNGVWRLSKGTVTNYTTKDGLGMDNIWTIYCDKQGKIWVGTEGEGVYTFDGKGFIPLKI